MNYLPAPFSLRPFLAVGLLGLAAVIGGCSKSTDAAKTDAAPAGGKKAGAVKIGFYVKQPEEPWFQLEWKFADQAARELGFTLVKMGGNDGEKALAAIDNFAAGGAQGFVICTPDTKLGPAIVNKARAVNLKFIAVDDQFLGADGQPLKNVHYLGISARKIGESVGDTLAAEMKKRGFALADTAVCAVTYDELATAKERTDGAISRLMAAGIPKERIFRAPMRTTDIPGALDSTNTLLTQQSGVKHWLVCGTNDNAVLGAIRALEGRGFAPESCVGIGINGTDCIVELEKAKPTSFHGSMLLSAKEHGYKTAEMLYKWIKDGVEPPLDTRTVGTLITRENFRQVLKDQGVRE
ncbi:arabinose ABC transporter substrate-binding protein [Horticoccus sp. 23ND18S-11]|uniref:arabinose ABC transporter substrate-binding protein n=1 Tax=Horticoccus sp. 23ND18S-11 TaxID=3391832 RepID=UPI0039C94F41